MARLLKSVKTFEDYKRFEGLLATRLKENNPISDNPMLDGLIIGFILTTGFSKDLFLDREMGRVLDGTIQKLEQILLWVKNNEKTLLKLVKDGK